MANKGSASISVEPALPHHGDTVRLTGETKANHWRFDMRCSRDGQQVLSAGGGSYRSSPGWEEIKLAGPDWPSGAARCEVKLLAYTVGTRTKQVGETEVFDVLP